MLFKLDFLKVEILRIYLVQILQKERTIFLPLMGLRSLIVPLIPCFLSPNVNVCSSWILMSFLYTTCRHSIFGYLLTKPHVAFDLCTVHCTSFVCCGREINLYLLSLINLVNREMICGNRKKKLMLPWQLVLFFFFCQL